MAEKESSQLKAEMSALKSQLDEGACNIFKAVSAVGTTNLTVGTLQQEISKDRTLQN